MEDKDELAEEDATKAQTWEQKTEVEETRIEKSGGATETSEGLTRTKVFSGASGGEGERCQKLW